MNRTLTAAVALAAGLGMAGLAHAQSSAGPSTQPNTMNSPTSTQNPAAMSSPSTNATRGAAGSQNGMQGPQASSQTNQTGGQASQSQIEQAQEQLKSKGLYNGAIDGVVGPETQTALSQFQRQNGLPETAQLDQQTMGALMGGNGGGNTGAASPQSYTPPAGTQNPATAPMQNPAGSSGMGAPSTTR